MKKILLLLLFPLFLGSTSKYQYKYEMPFAPVIYQGINDSIPTIDQFGRIRNGIIAQRIIDTMNNDPSGVDLTRAEQDYVRAIVGGLYITGMWQRSVAIYGFVGGNAWKHKWNWKDMRDLTAAFRLVFFNSPTHNSTGVVWNGTTQYANTFLIPNTVLSTSSNHLSYYTSTNNLDGIQIPIGALDINASYLQLNLTSANFISGTVNSIVSYTPTKTNGFTIGSKIASNNQFIYFNGFKLSSSSIGSLALPINEVYMGARNRLGAASISIDFFSLHTCSFASIGSGLTDQIAINSSQVITYSQGILNRQ